MNRARLELTRLAQNWRASRALRERVRFVTRETIGRRRTCLYRLRGGDLKAVVRHPIVDAYLVGEVFAGEYDLPDVVGERLARLGRPARVVDLGGNIGLFGLHIHGKLACRVTSVEPDPRNAAILRRCVAANPHLDWEIVEAAAGTEDGEVEFISDFALGQATDVAEAFGGHTPYEALIPPALHKLYPPRMLVTVPVVDILPTLTDCDLVKIDIEGAEWPILADPRFAEIGASAIVIEAHAAGGRVKEAAHTLEAALAKAGFELLRPWRPGSGVDTIWAVR